MKTVLILLITATCQLLGITSASSTARIDLKPISPWLIGSDDFQNHINALDVD
jgi:hypothetical protein